MGHVYISFGRADRGYVGRLTAELVPYGALPATASDDNTAWLWRVARWR